MCQSVDFEINKTLFQLTPRTLQRLHRWLLKSGLSIVGNTNCFNNISGTLSKLSQGIKKTKKALRANTTCSRTAWDSCVAFLLLALQGVADQVSSTFSSRNVHIFQAAMCSLYSLDALIWWS